jgi:two-component system cell cycle sensor histidine kinase/response regulator CckA
MKNTYWQYVRAYGSVRNRMYRALLNSAPRALANFVLLIAAVSATAAQPGRGEVVVGIERDFAPYEFLDETGIPAGFDVDLIRAVAGAAGFEVRLVAGSAVEIQHALTEGAVQVVAGALHSKDELPGLGTATQHTLVDYTIFARTGAPKVRFAQDLAGMEVLVQRGSAIEANLRDMGAPFRIVTAVSDFEALRTVASGGRTYALVARPRGLLIVGKLGLADLDTTGPPLFSRHLCFEVRPGDGDLLARLTTGLQAIRASGQYDRLHKKWLGLLQPPSMNLMWVFRHAALFLVPLVILLVGFVTWSWALSKRVERRTRRLRSELAERQRVEEALRESESRFRALADTVPFGILILQEERIVYANRSAQDLYGYPAAELLGVSPWQFVHPEYVELVRGRYGQRLAGAEGLPDRYEIKVVTKQGAERWVECSVAVSTFGGRPATVVAYSDVTDRRRSQEIQAAIYEISEAAHSAETLDELFSSLHRIVGRLMAATNFYIALYDPETDLLSFPYFVDEQDERPEPLKPGRGMTGYVLRTGQPLLATAEAIEKLERAGELHSLGTPSIDWLGVPLRVRERVIGVLAVQSYSGKVRYGETELDILSYVSTQAAQAIERKQAEQELRESQRQLFTLMSNLPGMAYRCANDEHWTMEFVSEGCLAVTGYHPADLVENRTVAYEDIIDPADRKPVRRLVEEAIAARRSFELYYRIRTATGDQKWVWERGSAVFSSEGQLLALEGFISDISERRKAEEALRQSEERYRLALQATQEIMYDWDVPNNTVFWNPNLTNVLGYAPEEMGTVERWGAQLHPDDAARVRRELAAAIDYGDVFSSEYRLRRKTGDFATLLNRGLILRQPDGKAIRMVGAITDLTVSKQLQDQLRQVQKIEAVGRIAGGIAHDFNNLLTALLGSTELLQRRLAGDHLAQQELATIHRAARRAADFTQGLLAFARRQVLEPVNVDLNGFISESLPMLRRMIPENIRIDLQAGGGLATVRADRGQLTQILMNLCLNARDAMPEGGTIAISTGNITTDRAFAETHPGAKPGRYVSLIVTDTGIGIDPEDLPHVFEPFFTTKTSGTGTGLGLSTVYGIVKQHGGYIYAESQPRSGATFSVYFPAVAARAELPEGPAKGAVQGGRETILVVEDEAEVRQILVQALTSFGYRVYEAADGLDALSLLRSESGGIELVLTDVVMPRMGGMELCQAARAIAPGLRFLFSSGYTENSVHVGFVKKEGVFFLAKPYGIDTLARKVREVLDCEQSPSELERN